MTIPALPVATQVRWTGGHLWPIHSTYALGFWFVSCRIWDTHTHHSDHTQGLRAMVVFISSLFG